MSIYSQIIKINLNLSQFHMQNNRLPKIFLASRVLVQQNLHPAMQAQKGGDTHFESLTPACTFLDETLMYTHAVRVHLYACMYSCYTHRRGMHHMYMRDAAVRALHY